MESQVIIPEYVVPETTDITQVTLFTFDVINKSVLVSTVNKENTSIVDIPLSRVWKLMTDNQRTIVKAFFKEFAKIALNTDTIIGDLDD